MKKNYLKVILRKYLFKTNQTKEIVCLFVEQIFMFLFDRSKMSYTKMCFMTQ